MKMTVTGSVPAGTRVGRYEIVSLLKQGGMGEVYAAQDCNLDRRVALKILPRNRTTDPDRVARFVREARASSTLNHPSIVSVHDAGSDGDVHFLAMELIDGEPLSEWKRKRRPLAARVELMAQVAEGLARAHDAGIVHRDLKPDNIMVTREGRAKIVDFGVAKLTERLGERTALSGITTPTSRVGTTAYMAPEQIEGKAVDRRTDVFAFGTVLYELLTGSNPFSAEQYADTIHNVAHLEPPLEKIPRSLRRIVARCLKKDAALRYDSLRDTALDLRESLDDLEEVPGRSRRIYLVLAALLAVSLLTLAIWREGRIEPRPVTPSRTVRPAMKMTRLTNNGKVTTAAISPDGNYLVHAVAEGNEQALYVKQIVTGSQTRIVEPAPAYYFQLSVSADGNYAYYVRAERSEPNIAHIYEVPLMGGAPRRIAEDTEFSFDLSPDGKSVAFRRFNAFVREHQVTIAAVDGSGETIVLRRKAPVYVTSPAWTPDGLSITFGSGNRLDKEAERGFYRLTLASRRIDKIPIPKFPGVGSYAWLRDGSGILASVHEAEQPPQIWFVPAGKTEGQKITSDVSAYTGITATGDSTSFVAVREFTDSNIWSLDLDAGENAVPRSMTAGFGNWVGSGVHWLNEHEILFSSYVSGTNTFFVLDARSGATRRLNRNLPMWDASLSPDRTKLAFVSDKSGSRQIWVADSTGENYRQVTQEGESEWPSFTPDGLSVVYLRQGESQFAWRAPIDGRAAPVQVTTVPTSQPRLSPDGRWLLCRLRSQEPGVPLWRTAIVSMDGKATTRYFDAPRFGGPPILQWHPDGRSFLFVDFQNGASDVWSQSLDGGAPRRLTSLESGFIVGFDLSDDGRRLVFSRGETTSDAVLIRDFR